jgi:hypothetical protein
MVEEGSYAGVGDCIVVKGIPVAIPHHESIKSIVVVPNPLSKPADFSLVNIVV